MYQTLPRGGADALPGRRLGELLIEARERTLALVEDVCDDALDRVHDALMSPLAWDLGHIAAFEDLWVSRAAGTAPLRPELWNVYDAEETPRAHRGELDYLRCGEAREYMREVGDRALSVLDEVDLSRAGDRLNADGFVWEMLIQHEHQHDETMLQTLQLAPPGTFAPDRRPLPRAPAERPGAMVRVEGGPFPLGAPRGAFAYDNERPCHEVDLPGFEIDCSLVSNADYLTFLEEGGYSRRQWWSEAGWAWRVAEGIERPLYWTEDGRTRSFERTEEIRPELPVMHVSFHEAEAFARSRGKRLPTEAEWEKAASFDPRSGRKILFPWGEEAPTPERANLDQTAFGPAALGAHPAGASPYGVLGLIGDAWEWTASELYPYPGFRAFPYSQYSETHFGRGHRVLRGGSWATRPYAIRSTFRSWDLPERRQIFTGFRCVAA